MTVACLDLTQAVFLSTRYLRKCLVQCSVKGLRISCSTAVMKTLIRKYLREYFRELFFLFFKKGGGSTLAQEPHPEMLFSFL